MSRSTTNLYENFYKIAQQFSLPKKSKWPVNRANYNYLILKCAESRNFGTAQTLLREMQVGPVKPTVVSYNSFLTGCMKSNSTDFAENIFNEMKLSKGIQPDSVSYTILISLLAKNRKIEKCYKLLEELENHPKANVNADVRTYFGILDALRKYDLAEAFSFVLKLREKNIKIDAPFTNALLFSVAISNSPESVADLFDSLRKNQFPIDAISYKTVIQTCGKIQNQDLVFYYISLMQKDKIELSESEFMEVFKFSKFETVFEYLKTTSNPEIFFKFVYHTGFNRMFDEMFSIIDLMLKRNIIPTTKFYNCMIHFLGKTRRFTLMQRAIKEMKEKNIPADSKTYSCIMTGYLYCKKYKDVEQIFNELLASDVSPSIINYTILLQSYSKSQQIEKGISLLKEMKQNDFIPTSVTFESIRKSPPLYQFAAELFNVEL